MKFNIPFQLFNNIGICLASLLTLSTRKLRKKYQNVLNPIGTRPRVNITTVPLSYQRFSNWFIVHIMLVSQSLCVVSIILCFLVWHVSTDVTYNHVACMKFLLPLAIRHPTHRNLVKIKMSRCLDFRKILLLCYRRDKLCLRATNFTLFKNLWICFARVFSLSAQIC